MMLETTLKKCDTAYKQTKQHFDFHNLAGHIDAITAMRVQRGYQL
jgi:hypothetical protein